MSSAPEPPTFKNEPHKEKDFRNPGLRSVRTTTLFRAVNPELFIKPVRNMSRIRLCLIKPEQTCNGFWIGNPFTLRGLYWLSTCNTRE
ncbi:small integral membrane protein 8 isoform X2 [Tupaia chinensis]|uniref:small integral membrane protein 8 isoform X2 n=1 Tax=Tupaia chinensis TaxID=246437 RepID=UPI000FFB4F99|nr:small integral membrane protein 8 isoform X2 [Tupaia chinensis]